MALVVVRKEVPGAPMADVLTLHPLVDTGVPLLFTETVHHPLVDALPYIDTQLGQTEVAQQVKALIDEEMAHFEPRDYLASLPAPELPSLQGDGPLAQEFARLEAGRPLTAIDLSRYDKPEGGKPEGNDAQDHGAWRKSAEGVQMRLEYNGLRLTNLELLERWGTKAWVAHSLLVKRTERLQENRAAELREKKEDINKRRKLDQVSCGNELRKLSIELEQYSQDNARTEFAVRRLESEVQRMKGACAERGVAVPEQGEPKKDVAKVPEVISSEVRAPLDTDGDGNPSPAKRAKITAAADKKDG